MRKGRWVDFIIDHRLLDDTVDDADPECGQRFMDGICLDELVSASCHVLDHAIPDKALGTS